jgi:periplasmic protein TonB
MLSSKLDLYKGEWLELVFDDRNKAYGAYQIRKHYDGYLVKAMAITFSAVICLFVGYNIIHKITPKDIKYTAIPYAPTVAPPIEKKPIIPPKPRTVEPPKTVATIKYPIFKPVIDKEADNPPKTVELQTAAISTETKQGNATDGNIDIPPGDSNTTGSDVTEDKTVHNIATVEVMPQFPGGEAAWGKFLQKNLHYPPQAVEAGVSGKVFVSFVVEKDGHLSNIKVERGPGYGLDEEAVRVLKMAPAWSPGIQNGQKVRVSYVMPITFQISSQD